MENLINCNCGATFFIKTLHRYGPTFICQKEGVLAAIRKLDKEKVIIAKILIFDFEKSKFVTCSLDKIIFHLNYQTEFMEYAKRHYYFSKHKF